uniref:Lipolytic protein G-D-S-L family n=1 Tax=Caulobacter sp. (strain K31) TaxID=366602 RepID=B0T7S4_CAUSK
MLGRRTLLAAALAAPTLGLAGRASAQVPVPAPATPNPEELRLHTDWPFLQRYAAENAADRGLPDERRRVVFMGDSITQGWRDVHPAFFADQGFIGRGIGGQVTAQMLVRFWPDVIALKPAAVHILAGTNDIAQNAGPYDPGTTCDNIRAMAALAGANGIKVILGAVTPAATYPWRPVLRPDLEIPRLNAWLVAFARAEGHGFADYTAVLDDGRAGMKSGLAYDQVHPTLEGYAVMEPVALKAVSAVLS